MRARVRVRVGARVGLGVTSSILGSSDGFIGSAAILITERVLKGRGLKMHVTWSG